jgi:peptidyl-prolyl cis-trans isomerase C
MLRRLGLSLALFVAACSKPASPWKGPVVAEGGGVTLRSDELLARLDEQSPAVRHNFSSPEGRQQFLDTLLQFKLVAQEAERQGLAADPEVQVALQRALVARYYQRFIDAQPGAATVPEADARRFYEDHIADYLRPARVNASVILIACEAGGPARAACAKEAAKLLGAVRTREATNPDAFAAAARERSDDPVTRPLGGQVGAKTREELEAWGAPVAEAAFKLAAGQTYPAVLEGARGLLLLRVTEQQPEFKRAFAEVRGQIAQRLAGQRQEERYRELVRKLREDARIRIDDAELAKVQVPRWPGAGGGRTQQ